MLKAIQIEHIESLLYPCGVFRLNMKFIRLFWGLRLVFRASVLRMNLLLDGLVHILLLFELVIYLDSQDAHKCYFGISDGDIFLHDFEASAILILKDLP
jgi:hypothetical protein